MGTFLTLNLSPVTVLSYPVVTLQLYMLSHLLNHIYGNPGQ